MSRVLALICLIFSTMGTGFASTFDGGGAGYADDDLTVQGCDSVTSSDFISFFHMDPKGRWSMDTITGSYTGTYSELKPRKMFSLMLDPSSYSDLLFGLQIGAEGLCSLPAGSTSIINPEVEVFTAKLNKKKTRLHIMLKISGELTDGMMSWTATYSFAGELDFSSSVCHRPKKKLKLDKKTKSKTSSAIGISDINNDGAVDIVVTENQLIKQAKFKCEGGFAQDCEVKTKRRGASGVALYLQDPFYQGMFLRQPNYPVSRNAKTKGKRPKSLVLSVAIGDLDEDSIQDIAVTHKKKNTVGVFLQDPGNPGLLLPVSHHPAGASPVDVAIGDLNGDGINDMAVAGKYLVLLLNDSATAGDTFHKSILGIADVSSVEISDLDGDGRNDLAATSGDSVIVLLQDPPPAAPGNYPTQTSHTTGISAADVEIGDLNGDSLPDLVVANRGETIGSVSVLMQDPGAVGTFLPGVSYETGPDSLAVVIDDLNGDSYPDLAVANIGGDYGSVSVLLQDDMTPGVFLSTDNYPGMRGPNDITSADLNDDSLQDLLITDICSRMHQRPYIRFQDAENPGNFLYPVFLP